MLLSIIFTSIVLTVNNTYSTFASPIVPNGSVTTGQSLNTHVLAKRDPPPDQKCSTPAKWKKRICTPIIGVGVWQDQCTSRDNGGPVVRFVTGLCPLNTMCTNVIQDYEETVVCTVRPVVLINPQPNQQTGVAEHGGVGLPNVQYIQSITLLNDISVASVSALLEGTY
jgi:hypothetical protein